MNEYRRLILGPPMLKGVPRASRSTPWQGTQLNPVEYLWAHWKQYEMPNFCPKDFVALSAFARASLKRTQRRKALGSTVWKHTGLPC